MSQDIPDTPNPHLGFGVVVFAGWAGVFRAVGLVAGRWLVAAGGVEGEFAEQFAGGGVDDADVGVLDQDQDTDFADATNRITTDVFWPLQPRSEGAYARAARPGRGNCAGARVPVRKETGSCTSHDESWPLPGQ